MGIAAAGSPDLAYHVAKATATEISACGVNMILGPVLDVLTNARYQPLGVRATSDDPLEVSQYGIAAMKGYKDAGLATCGKHFPSYGNLDFLGSSLDIPIITQTLEELSLSAIVPFRNAIASGRLDAMFVGGCGIANSSMNVGHACLSDQIVDDLLRNELGFRGVVFSECLEMEALSHDIGVKGGTVMAVEAGCDIVMLCRAYDVQLEAIAGLQLGYANGILNRHRILTSLRRVLRLKNGCTSWATALSPPALPLLSKIHNTHLAISRKAYDDSITVMRDRERLLPLSRSMQQQEELLLLTPLVKPLPASSATKTLENKHSTSSSSSQTIHDKWLHRDRSAIMSGEGVFRGLGRSLARARHGKLLHTSYTANGLRPVHENLIHRASTIIIVTADANRNLYQAGFTKHVAMMCSMLRASGQKKNLIVVAVSSPYDFAMDKTIDTYICTFDFTEMAMSALVRALFSDTSPSGTLPGTLRKSKKVVKSRRNWLVEPYNRDRDGKGLDELLQSVARASGSHLQYLRSTTASSFELSDPNIEESHLVVRNSSTQTLYGFCATYRVKNSAIGIIGGLFIDPAKRNVSVGRSLHRCAVRNLSKTSVTKLQLGSSFPGVFLGIPIIEEVVNSTTGSTVTSPMWGAEGEGKVIGRRSMNAAGLDTFDPATTSDSDLRSWFARGGWKAAVSRRITNLVIPDLKRWSPPEGLTRKLVNAGISFDLIQGPELADSVLKHAVLLAGPEIVELYRYALSQANNNTCAVVRAKMTNISSIDKNGDDADIANKGAGSASDASEDTLLGTVIVCSPCSAMAKFLPPLQPLQSLHGSSSATLGNANYHGSNVKGRTTSFSVEDGLVSGLGSGSLGGGFDEQTATSGIVAPLVVASEAGNLSSSSAALSASSLLVLQGLAMMAVRQNKNHRAVRSVLSRVTDEMLEALLAMQFEVLKAYDELTVNVQDMNIP